MFGPALKIEDPKDLGFVRLEVSIGVTGTGIAQAGKFGLGLAVDSSPNASYKLPGHDGFPLLSNDVASWRMSGLRKPSHVTVDGQPRSQQR